MAVIRMPGVGRQKRVFMDGIPTPFPKFLPELLGSCCRFLELGWG